MRTINHGEENFVMIRMHKYDGITLVFAAILWTTALVAHAQSTEGEKFSSEQIQSGSRIYAQNCAPCHGPRMSDPEGAFDLRKFPRDERTRFINSVSNGKNSMPPWRGLLSPEDIASLWAYLVAGEK